MKILFINKNNWPHVGGVEKHIFKLSQNLKKEGHKVKVLSSDGNGDYNINYPKIKYLGLFLIWLQLFKLRKTILNFDIIYINKWYGIKSDYVTYGGVNKQVDKRFTKIKNSVVFLGRLEKDTGIKKFL